MPRGKRYPKVYGAYKRAECPFCGKMATAKNAQGIEVCNVHTTRSVKEFKCTCGSWLEPRGGKFGIYFNCINCGNINNQKAMQIKDMTHQQTVKANTPQIKPATSTIQSAKPKPAPVAKKRRYFFTSYEEDSSSEKTITSRDVDYF